MRHQSKFKGRGKWLMVPISGLALVAAAIATIPACTPTSSVTTGGGHEYAMPEATSPTFAAVALLYGQHCAACHGDSGNGNGPASQTFSIRPRAFRYESFRFISTTSGGAPSKADLVRVMKRGISRADMPGHPQLTDSELNALADYIREIRRIGLVDQIIESGTDGQSDDEYGDDDYGSDETVMTREEATVIANAKLKPGPSMVVPDRPSEYVSNRNIGRALYVRNCAVCHGQRGRGDSSVALLDELNRSIRPRDLSLGHYSGGDADRDLYWRIRLGIPGTPMPGFSHLSDGDVWQLVDYMRLLAKGRL